MRPDRSNIGSANADLPFPGPTRAISWVLATGNMQRVLLPYASIQISRLSFGTASLHRLVFARERANLLHKALECGISHFDTAPYYGFGLAEADLGEVLVGRRQSITVATKVGMHAPGAPTSSVAKIWARKVLGKIAPSVSAPRWDWSVAEASRSLDESLKRLRTDYVDILFVHEPDPTAVQPDELLDWLHRMRDSGRVRSWGLAGEPFRLEPWIRSDHPLAQVLQTRDSVSGKESDDLLRHGRRADLTYGYFASLSQGMDALSILRKALERNQHGSVVFSTRQTAHLTALARSIP